MKLSRKEDKEDARKGRTLYGVRGLKCSGSKWTVQASRRSHSVWSAWIEIVMATLSAPAWVSGRTLYGVRGLKCFGIGQTPVWAKPSHSI
ncbi:hypothetical protein [Paenibacillus polymyxa]|uniref:hypothetical protein n=1 Tax=Paenibacillus polymyxa TaxID=1406 RepID=UPI003F86FCEE